LGDGRAAQPIAVGCLIATGTSAASCVVTEHAGELVWEGDWKMLDSEWELTIENFPGSHPNFFPLR
jgi:hypothetical protein